VEFEYQKEESISQFKGLPAPNTITVVTIGRNSSPPPHTTDRRRKFRVAGKGKREEEKMKRFLTKKVSTLLN